MVFLFGGLLVVQLLICVVAVQSVSRLSSRIAFVGMTLLFITADLVPLLLTNDVAQQIEGNYTYRDSYFLVGTMPSWLYVIQCIVIVYMGWIVVQAKKQSSN